MTKFLLALAGTLLPMLAAPVAGAQPYPGCPWISYLPMSVCSENPPVPGLTPGFSMTPGIPGTWGPDGLYTPCTYKAPC